MAISELSLVWYDPTVVSNLGKDEKMFDDLLFFGYFYYVLFINSWIG